MTEHFRNGGFPGHPCELCGLVLSVWLCNICDRRVCPACWQLHRLTAEAHIVPKVAP